MQVNSTIAQKHGIDPAIMTGMLETESGWLPDVVRHRRVVEPEVLHSLCLLRQHNTVSILLILHRY